MKINNEYVSYKRTVKEFEIELDGEQILRVCKSWAQDEITNEDENDYEINEDDKEVFDKLSEEEQEEVVHFIINELQ